MRTTTYNMIDTMIYLNPMMAVRAYDHWKNGELYDLYPRPVAHTLEITFKGDGNEDVQSYVRGRIDSTRDFLERDNY